MTVLGRGSTLRAVSDVWPVQLWPSAAQWMIGALYYNTTPSGAELVKTRGLTSSHALRPFFIKAAKIETDN